MNRILKKAVSFISAVAMSASVFMTMPVTASAATSSLKTSQTVSNNYDVCIAMDSGVFFMSGTKNGNDDSFGISSKTSMVMLTSGGKKLTIKNTAGYDKVYASITPGYSYGSSSGDFVALGKDGKRAVLLTNGKYLENGKLFDSVTGTGGCIAATTGKTTYYYTSAGKTLAKSSSDYKYNYDEASGTLLLSKTASYGYKVSVVKGGKTLATLKSKYLPAFETIGTTTYISTYSTSAKSSSSNAPVVDTGENNIYYTLKGKKASSLNVNTPGNLSLSYDYNRDNDNWEITVTDKNGKEVLSCTAKNSPSCWTINGNLILSCGRLYIIDDKTGEIKTKTADKGFSYIDGYSETGSSYIIQTVDKDYNYGVVLCNSKGKVIADGYSQIVPVDTPDGNYYTYTKTSAFLVCKNGKWGLINSSGKTILKPTYASRYYGGGAYTSKLSILSSSSGKDTIIDNKTGTKLKTVDDAECIIRISDKLSYVITANKAKTKYGCMVVKG